MAEKILEMENYLLKEKFYNLRLVIEFAPDDNMVSATIAHLLHNAFDQVTDQISGQKDITPEQLMPLVSVLQDIWFIIKDTNYEYTIATRSPLTIICLEIAKYLEPIFNKSRFQLLMPTITINSSYITTTDLLDPKLELQNIIPNQHGGFIELAACLEFAEDDGKLKYTDIYDEKTLGEMVELDQQRVINHSKEANEYWKLIRIKFTNIHDRSNMGGKVQHLMEQLRRGDAYLGNGLPNNAGSYANEAISEFSLWLETLSEFERNDLMSRSSRGLGYNETFQDCWERLIRKNEPKNTVGHCVYLIAASISSILTANKDLYDNFTLGDIEREMENKKKLFQTTLNENHQTVTFRFNNAEKTLLENLLILSLNPDKKIDISGLSRNAPILLFAIKHGLNIARLVAHGFDINSVNEYGQTALILAIGSGDVDLAHELIINGADIYKADNNGISPVYLAENGYFYRSSISWETDHEKKLRLIVSLCSNPTFNVNAIYLGDESVLTYAIKNNLDIKKLLSISDTIDVNIYNKKGKTPLIVAIQRGNINAIKLLIAAGADITKPDSYGRTPIYWAVNRDHRHEYVEEGIPLLSLKACPLPILECFYSHPDFRINEVKIKGETLLTFSIKKRLPVDKLLYHGIDVNAVENNGKTALMLAIRLGRTDIFRELIAHGADVNKADNFGRRPLDWVFNIGSDVELWDYNHGYKLVSMEHIMLDIINQLLIANVDISLVSTRYPMLDDIVCANDFIGNNQSSEVNISSILYAISYYDNFPVKAYEKNYWECAASILSLRSTDNQYSPGKILLNHYREDLNWCYPEHERSLPLSNIEMLKLKITIGKVLKITNPDTVTYKTLELIAYKINGSPSKFKRLARQQKRNINSLSW